jgi:hypothetical protein
MNRFVIVVLLAISVFTEAHAEYPILTSSQDRCLADIRVAPPVRNLDPSTYPNVQGSPGPVTAGQNWSAGEGYALCVRLSGNCKDYANSFYCVSSSKGINEGNPVTGTF